MFLVCTHSLDGSRARDILVVWVRNSTLAVQQRLDRQHCLVVHPYRERRRIRRRRRNIIAYLVGIYTEFQQYSYSFSVIEKLYLVEGNFKTRLIYTLAS